MYRTVIINGSTSITIQDASASKKRKLAGGKITREPNSIASYAFELYPHNIGYNDIVPLQTLVHVYNTDRQRYEFKGRVLKAYPEMDSNGVVAKRVICEDRLGYLNDSVQPYVAMKHYTGDATRTGLEEFIDVVLGYHNAHVEAEKRIQRGRVTVVPFKSSSDVTKQLNYQTTWATLREKLVGSFGGFLILRETEGVKYLDYLEEVGSTRGTVIALGRNMKSASRELDPTHVITRLYPLGAKIKATDESGQEVETEERVSIRSVNGGLDYIDATEYIEQFGIIEGTYVWDDVTIPTNLLSRGRVYLADSNGIYASNRITALDLSLLGLDPDDFTLYDRYPVVNRLIGLNDTLQIVKQTIDTVQPEQSTFDMGDTVRRMSDLIADSQSPAKGEAGRSSFLHIRYSENASGAGMVPAPTASTKYIGLAETASPIAPTDYTVYAWSQYVGRDGSSVTILGSYDSYSELIAAHPTGSPGDAYMIGSDLWVWSDDNQRWVNVGRIKGDDGVSILATTPYYAKGSSPTVKPSDPSIPEWTVTAPALGYGEYLWCAYLITYSAGNPRWTEPFNLRSADALVQAAAAPVNPAEGTLWLDTSSDTCNLMRYNGTDWDIVADTTEQMNAIYTRYDERFEAYDKTLEGLTQEFGDVTTSLSDAEQIVETMKTILGMNAEGVSLTFQRINESLTAINGDVNTQKNTLEKYIRFVDGAIEIGEKGNDTLLKLENDILGFYQNGVRVAYFNSGKLFVDKLEAITSLQLGRYAFVPNSTGGMSLKYTGA